MIFFLFLLLGFVAYGQTPKPILESNSISIGPGTWKQVHVTTNSGNTSDAGYTRTLFQDLCNNSSGVGSFKDKIQWDPAGKTVWFSGADAGGNLACGKVLKFDEVANTWSAAVPNIRSVLSPLGITTITHNYEQSAFDPATKRLYWRSFNSKRFWFYDTVANSWTEIASYPWAFAQTSSMEWIEPMGGLIVADNGRVSKYTPATNTWTLLASSLAFGYSNFLDYNPVLGIVLFGGGGSTPNKLFKMTVPGGVVSPLTDSPFALGTQSPSGAVVTHDPVSGKFIILPQSGVLQAYDVDTQSWTALGAAPFYTGNGAGNVQAVPIPEYQTIFFTVNKQTIWGNNQNGTWLYKYAGSAPPPPGPPDPPTGLKIAKYDISWLAGIGEVKAFGYRIYDDGEEIGNTTQLTFSVALEPGEHHFVVRAYGSEGQLSEPSESLTFTVTEP